GLGQEVGAVRQLEQHGVDQVVAVEVGVEDEVRRVADVGQQVAHVGQELDVQVVAVGGLEGQRLLLEEPPVFLEDAQVAGGLESGAELAVDALQPREVLVYLGLLADQVGAAGEGAVRVCAGG